MNYGILVQGELTIIGQDGQEKVVHEGEAVVEMVDTIHHGENRGTKDCILYMFYLSLLNADLDISAVSWIPMGNDNNLITGFEGTFFGNAHTIRIKIENAIYKPDSGD